MSKRARIEEAQAFIFLGPALIIFLCLVIGPLLFSGFLAFTDWKFTSGLSGIRWVGLKNFNKLATDRNFNYALKNTFIYTLTCVPLSVLISMLMAHMLNGRVYFQKTLRTFVFIPYISNMVALALLFRCLFRSDGIINSILQNEKYRGDARLQKKFTVDFLQKKMKVNEGEVPQYYVENSHPPIIDPQEWDLVQAEISRRKKYGRQYSSHSIFSSMLICGDCGGYYGSKIWHSTDKYKRTIWQCNGKFKGEHHCTTPHLSEADIKALFLRAFGKLMSARVSILEDCRLVQAALSDCSELEAEQKSVADEMEITAELIRWCVDKNAATAQDQADYYAQYEGHVKRYAELKTRYETAETERQRRQEQGRILGEFIRRLEEQTEPPIEFNDDLWLAVIDHATVNADETVVFSFKGGIEIIEQL